MSISIAHVSHPLVVVDVCVSLDVSCSNHTDNNGRLYDGVGQNIDWWSEHSSNEFIARSDCFIKQYSNYSMFGLHINGTQCLPEDIADNGGISLAWRSYRAYYSNPVNNATLAEPLLPGYTNDQLFWIYGAQQVRQTTMTTQDRWKST